MKFHEVIDTVTSSVKDRVKPNAEKVSGFTIIIYEKNGLVKYIHDHRE